MDKANEYREPISAVVTAGWFYSVSIQVRLIYDMRLAICVADAAGWFYSVSIQVRLIYDMRLAICVADANVWPRNPPGQGIRSPKMSSA